MALLMLQIMACSVRLLDMNNLKIAAATYLLESFTKYSVEYFSKTFDMMLHQERVKQLSSGFSMEVDSQSTLVNNKSIVKLANTSYHSLCKQGAFDVPIKKSNTCLNCDAPDHGVVIFHHKNYQKNILGDKKKFIKIKQGLVPAQDVHFFYTRSHLRVLQSHALIFSTNFQFNFIFK